MPRVTFLTNTKSLAACQRTRGKVVSAAMKAQSKAWGEAVKRSAEALSQGAISTQDLQRYKPGLYSQARAASPNFDAEINKHSGKFASSWRVGTWDFANYVTTTVWNECEYARFMVGTVRMRKRDILGRAQAQSPSHSLMMLQAKRKAEGSVSGSLVMQLVNVAVTVTVAYGGAAFEG